jgi:3-methyladenine DNA glycosylase/8-oxoguanine DNA glycosylase
MLERTLAVSHPLDLGATLRPLWRGNNGPCSLFSEREVWRATRTSEGPVTLRVKRTNDGVTAMAWGVGAQWSLQQLPQLLGADDDLGSFRPEHPCLKDAARRTRGLRMCKTLDVFEALIPTILEQKVTGREARSSWRSLVRAHGEPAPGPAPLLLPPTPEILADLPYFEFHPHGIEQKRAVAIKEVCRRASKIREVAHMDSDAAARRLQAFKGIGPWTTGLILQIVLGDPDAVVLGDYHFPNQVAWALGDEPRGTDERMLELLAPYKGHRGRVVRILDAAGIRAPKFGPRARIRNIAAI